MNATFWSEGWAEFRRSPVAVVALAVVVVIVALALLAPLISPQDPYDQTALDLMDARLEPGSVGSGEYVHWLGTDNAGRDLLSAILYGLRTSLAIAVTAGMAALVVGTAVGLSAAYYGGWYGAVMMRIVDLQLSLPAILLALVIVAMLGQGVPQLMAALVAAQYAYFARTAFGAASAERRRDYIEAALSTPLSGGRVLWRHLLPNTLPPLIVVVTVQIASAISLEATLSFLGLGLPVTRPSLGLLISNGFQFMLSGRYWISVYPGLALMVTVLAINLVGDQLRQVINPRRRR
ncbi:ABC transporter permease [Muricoccus radiodurans]|uniref:ABC transporter permease n=1 Tax=Muricoccus radiodurans TaxID=2231721 RepID=UPI003CE80A9D